ncbi:MAG: PE family protein, partial [Acidimicrobiia bacterium]
MEFECTGSAQAWTVPAGVTEATFDLLGAQGGAGAGPGDSGTGGKGGRTEATLSVTPGETLGINVGCQGDDASGATPGAGGYGGAGAVPGDGGG